jgi:hypothetical protein
MRWTFTTRTPARIDEYRSFLSGMVDPDYDAFFENSV